MAHLPSSSTGRAALRGTAAAARTALGVVSSTAGEIAARAASPTPGSLHVCTEFDTLLIADGQGAWRFTHGGPLAVTRGPIAAGATNWISELAASGNGPVGGPGTSFAIGLHVDSLPGATERVLVENLATNGWLLGVSKAAGTANRLYLFQKGINSDAKVELADLATGSYAIAISVSPTEIRWSIKGAAVGSVAISGTYVPPDASSRFVIGNNLAGDLAFTVGSFAWFLAWPTILSDAALQAVSAAHATYLPGLSGAQSIAGWLAGAAPWDATYQRLVGAPGLRLALTPVATTMGWTAR